MVLSNVYSTYVVRRAYYSAVLKYMNVSVSHLPCAFVHEDRESLRARSGIAHGWAHPKTQGASEDEGVVGSGVVITRWY